MTGTIKGITIEIGGNTTELVSALSKADKAIKNTQASLNSVQKALKLDPGNTKLLTEQQKLLAERVNETKERLKQLKDAQAQMKADGVDKNSEQYRALQAEIGKTEARLKDAKKALQEFGSVGAQQIALVGKKFEEIGNKVSGLGKTLSTAVTVPLVAIGAQGVKSFAEVDKTMTLVNATMGNTAEEADLLNKAMKDAAGASTFGMNDAATATLNFARAGLDATEAAAALAPAMNLAAAEGGDLDTVSGGLVATLNGFGDSFDNASKYADVFANACNNSALDVNGLSQAMSVAAPIFKTAGYEVEDAALYMGVMANAGIEASVAANSLKTGMARLVKPAKEGAGWMEELGITVTNADGSMKDSVTVQQELHDAFAGLSESEQIAAASAIFGKNQMSNWLALINTAPSEVGELSASLKTEGTVASQANAMMSGFGGSLERIKSAADVAVTSLGEALAPTISKVAEKIQSAVDWFNSLDSSQQQTIATVGMVIAAIGPLLVVLGTVISSVGKIMQLAPLIAGALNPVTIAIGLVVAAIGIWIKNWEDIKAVAASVCELIGDGFKALGDKLGKGLKDIGDNMSKTWNGVKTTVSGAISNVKSSVSTGINNVKTTVSTGMSNVKKSFSDGMSNAKTSVNNALSSIKSFFSEKLADAKKSTSDAMSDVKKSVSEGMSNAKKSVNDTLNDVKTYFSEKLTDAKKTTSDKMADIHNSFKSKMDESKKHISTTLSNIKGFFDTHLGGAWDTVKDKFGNILGTIKEKMDEVKKYISDIIQKIKDLFNFDLKLNIKVPHIKVQGGEAPYGIGGKGKLPSFSVEWYDKGGIFNKPSIIGVGEKRPEFVGALDDLRQLIREESGGGLNTQLLTQMVSLLTSMAGQSRNVVVNQTINAQNTSYAAQQKEAAYEFKRIARAI